MLRIQTERMTDAAIPDAAKYHEQWGLTAQRLTTARPDCLVLHPGPANPGVEITTEVLEGPRSAVMTQVQNGVHVRAHLLAELARGD
jgi:aspartate carbamoyltransferase catalytic subunit